MASAHASDPLIVDEFDRLRATDSTNAPPPAVCAIRVLTAVIERSPATTMRELLGELERASAVLKQTGASISIDAACDLFCKYVSHLSIELPDFAQCKAKLIERGARFADTADESRKLISQFGDRFIHDGKVVLVHGRSRVVAAVLKHAAQQGKRFSVIVTEGRPAGSGYAAARELLDANIPCTLVLDSAVGYVMERVDLVLVGAEGVVESGGIINLVGTYQIAMVAKALKRPLYVAAESYKFVRLFPLQQIEVPNTLTNERPPQPPLALAGADAAGVHPHLQFTNASCDYTPPDYITLLFTDRGILTPAAISDELIKLYY